MSFISNRVDRRKRRNWAYTLLLFLFVVPVADGKKTKKKLGSPKPGDCEPWMHQCPPRFLCMPRRELGGNHCVCNRFLGFMGTECRKRSRASWLLLVLSIINAIMSFRALLSNIMLALELKNTGRLKANNIGRTLLFNTVASLPVMTIAIGISLIVLEVDTNVDFVAHGLQVCQACLLFFYYLSTLSISMVWIVDVQRMSSLGLGRESRLAKKRQERIWLLVTYVVALSCVALGAILFVFSSPAPIAIVICSYNIIVAGSYHYAGRRVVRDLSLSETNPTARHVDIAQIAENIRVMSQAMTRLTLVMSVSSIGAALTAPMPTPLYRAQNSLPRILQGQICVFVIQQCALAINNLIVEYMRYGSSKRHLKPESHTLVLAIRWLICRSRVETHPRLSRAAVMPSVPSAGGVGWRGSGYSSNHSNVSSISELTTNSGGGSNLTSEEGRMVWSQLRFNLNGLEARNQCIAKVAVNYANGLIQPQFCSLLSSSAEPFLPMVLITLLRTKVSGGGGTSVAISEQVVGQAVMDIGEDVVVNLDSDDMTTKELGVLSKGSHAFVQCYGEEHLRCTWHAFEFGFAGGHEFLAVRCTVLQEGELEVDAQGVVTRWLHRGGVNTSPILELDIPPRWVVKQAGLPFSAAWIQLSALDISKLEASCQTSLISDGILIRINCRTQQRTPANTSVLDISGILQTPRIASTSQANIASLKAAITNVCIWEDISASSAASDTSSDRSESIDSFGRAAIVVRGVQMCAVPRSRAHNEDIWIMNLSGSGMWKYSPLEEAYISARECLASCWLPKFPTNVSSKQDNPAGSHRTGTSGGSRGTISGEGRPGDTADNEGDVEMNSSGIEGNSGDDKLTRDGPMMGSLGAITEERPEEF